LTVIVVSFFESVLEDHSKDHPMAVAYLRSDTLTGIRTPPCRTQLGLTGQGMIPSNQIAAQQTPP